MKSRDSADFVGYMISDEPPQEAMKTSQDHELKLSSRQSFFGRCALIWMVGIWRNFFFVVVAAFLDFSMWGLVWKFVFFCL